MPFDQFARQRIFDPLGMKDTSFYPGEGNPRIATLYEQADGQLRKASNPAFMNGAISRAAAACSAPRRTTCSSR